MNLILNIRKEKDLSSFDVVRFLRRKFNERRMGFLGTLDAFAEGVLPVFTGEYTKLIPFLEKNIKEYRFLIKLGFLTDTLDVTGKTLKECPVDRGIEKKIVEERVKKAFMQDYEQSVPAFSAAKIKGVPSYRLARKGVAVENRTKAVRIYSFEISRAGFESIEGSLTVSPGFYVRQFASDLGEALGTCATLAELTRTRNGLFKIEDSVRMEDAGERDSVSPQDVLKERAETLCFEKDFMAKLRNGREIDCECIKEGLVLAMEKEGDGIIMAKSTEGKIKAVRVIH